MKTESSPKPDLDAAAHRIAPDSRDPLARVFGSAAVLLAVVIAAAVAVAVLVLVDPAGAPLLDDEASAPSSAGPERITSTGPAPVGGPSAGPERITSTGPAPVERSAGRFDRITSSNPFVGRGDPARLNTGS